MKELHQIGHLRLAELTGATTRQLDYWLREGIVRIDGEWATGSGGRRKYSVADVLKLRAVSLLRSEAKDLERSAQVVAGFTVADLTGETVVEWDRGRIAGFIVDFTVHDDEADLAEFLESVAVPA